VQCVVFVYVYAGVVTTVGRYVSTALIAVISTGHTFVAVLFLAVKAVLAVAARVYKAPYSGKLTHLKLVTSLPTAS
jgi:hypothetical protein